MANDDDARAAVCDAAGAAGEAVWPMPLPDDLRAALDSGTADIANIGDRHGRDALARASSCASSSPPGQPWVHLDIAGPVLQRQGRLRLHPQGRHRLRRCAPSCRSPPRWPAGRRSDPAVTPCSGAVCRTAADGGRMSPHSDDSIPTTGAGDSGQCRPGDPRRRQRRLRLRPARGRARHVRDPHRQGQARRHLPAPRLHPHQGAAARGRGGRQRQGERRVRRPGDLRGHRHAQGQRVPRRRRRPALQGPAGPGEEPQRHLRRGRGPPRRPEHRRGQRRAATPAPTSCSPPAPTRAACPASTSAAGS